ncbi:dipeptide epimerase [Saccharopolyspora gloriosae]|uniref:Dipeptide epimerase n=1 Tax=Saccharopolyspora gloriosae TaxID=455344 RepID=A0A840NGT5_9PSEU|nr:L-alanine-DL-glutamate epimerase-like enolase superfamily enzyme [Saccharopolyspora gloriosae]
MKLTWHTGTLRLREPFRISRSVMHERDAVWIDVSHDGHIGHGEAVTSVYYDLDVPRIVTQLEALRPVIDSSDDPGALLIEARRWVVLDPGLRCAVEAAVHDLAAKCRGITVRELVGAPEFESARTACTIGIVDVAQAVRTATDLVAKGFGVLKVKLGDGTDDAARVAAIRAAAPDARLLLDPNGAWEPGQALRILETLEPHGISAVEQPIRPGTPADLGWVAQRSPIPVIADEDAHTIDDVRELGSSVHGVNVKLAKCGGIQAAVEIIETARSAGVDVMLGCLVASSLGIAPAVHLAGFARWTDLDGHLLLADDPWDGIGGIDGTLRLSGRPGLGVRPRSAT